MQPRIGDVLDVPEASDDGHLVLIDGEVAHQEEHASKKDDDAAANEFDRCHLPFPFVVVVERSTLSFFASYRRFMVNRRRGREAAAIAAARVRFHRRAVLVHLDDQGDDEAGLIPGASRNIPARPYHVAYALDL